MSEWLHWSTASRRALYGPDGFYRRPAGPSDAFRTSVQVGPVYANAVLALLLETDAALGFPEPFEVVDVGAGHGELSVALHRLAPPALRQRLRLTAVEIADRPESLPDDIAWQHEIPDSVTGALVANEWLDDVPLDVAVQTPAGPRLLLVDPSTGEELADGPPDAADLAWLRRWWPLEAAAPGSRAEIGRTRDEAWAGAITALGAGLALAVDYCHDVETRAGGDFSRGTLLGYRAGRAVPPVPDGSCDITAHVALDSCAAAGSRAGATETALTSQREALLALGVRAGRPPYALASSDPQAYLRQLREAGEAAELLACDGLGDFGWLAQSVGVALPRPLRAHGVAG